MRLVAVVAVTVAVSGCGDSIASLDAGTPVDSNRGLVSVHYRTSRPVAPQAVYFQNVDSSLVLATSTNEAGKANAFMAPGGFVTIVVNNGANRLFTYTDVQPGDELVLDDGFELIEPVGSTHIRLRIPADPQATDYWLFSSCGSAPVSGAEAIAVDVFLDNCGDLADMLVVSNLGTEQQRWLLARDVVVEDNTSVTLQGTYAPFVRSTVTVTGVPATIPLMRVTHSLLGRGRDLWPGNQVVEVIDGVATLEQPMPVPPDGVALVKLDPEDPFSSAHGAQRVIEWGRSTAAKTIDYSADALRAYTSQPRYDTTSNTVRWTESPDGTLADTAIVGLTWAGPPNGEGYNWFAISARGDEPVVRLPLLPVPELVVPAQNFPILLRSIAIEGGYARIRERLLGTWLPSAGPWPVDGDSGRAVYQDLQFGEFDGVTREATTCHAVGCVVPTADPALWAGDPEPDRARPDDELAVGTRRPARR